MQLSCPYFVKKTSILSKIRCSNGVFFLLLHEKPHFIIHIIGQKTTKNANFAKNLLYYWPKESIGYPFFRFFTKSRYSLSHFFSKNRLFCEELAGLMPIFCQKNVHSLKTLCSRVIFFNFFKTPRFHAQERSKLRQFCENYILSWSKNINWPPLVSKLISTKSLL